MKLYYLENNMIKSEDVRDVCFDKHCEILCVGAGCAGIFSAIAASREGADVILIEYGKIIGGMHVSGAVTSYYFGGEGGTFESVDARCKEDNVFFGGMNQPNLKGVFLTEELKKCNVNVLYDQSPVGVYFDNDRAVGIKVFVNGFYYNIKTEMIIDSTSDGHIIRMCPVNKRYGRQIDGKMVPFTVRTHCVRSNDYRLFNSDSGYLNQYDSRDFSKKIIAAHANTSVYLKNEKYLSLSYRTGVREGLGFEGEDTLTYKDIMLGKTYHKILFYAYSDIDKHGHDLAIDEEFYQNWWVISNLATVTVNIPVPMGSVVLKGIKGLVTAGRCLSCDSYAQSAVRMNRDMFRMGECVGIAAAMAVKNGTDFLDVDYEEYRKKADLYNCFNSKEDIKFGFHGPAGNIPYSKVDFSDEGNLGLLKTDKPGVAIWSCFVAENREEMNERVTNILNSASDNLTRYNCAIALGIMGNKRCLPILREIVNNRDCFYFKDSRRSNQFRTAVAICLLGRLGEKEDAELLEGIVFDDGEFEREMYHTLEPCYLYYVENDRNFVYFQVFTHAAMSLVKLCKAHKLNRERYINLFVNLFSDDKIIRRVTNSAENESSYIEIADFQKHILKLLSEN